MSWKLYEGDCLKVMPTLQDDSFDLIILDPPYNINKAEWDKIGTHEEYLKFIEDVLVECQRVLKDNGSLYLWHNQFPVLCDFQGLICEKTDLVFKQLLVWNKIDKSFNNSGFTHQKMSIDMARNYKGEFTEYCLFYTFQDETGLTTVKLDLNNFTTLRQYFKDFQKALGLTKKELIDKLGQCVDHPFRWKSSQWCMPTEETYQKLCELPLKNNEFVRREYEDLRREYEDLRYTYNVINVKEDYRGNSNVWLYPPETGHHPTQKPIPLSENIIKHSSNVNDNVLIPFAGSGSEMIASTNLNRNVVGIEQNPQYCQLIRERLNEHTTQSRLQLPAK